MAIKQPPVCVWFGCRWRGISPSPASGEAATRFWHEVPQPNGMQRETRRVSLAKMVLRITAAHILQSFKKREEAITLLPALCVGSSSGLSVWERLVSRDCVIRGAISGQMPCGETYAFLPVFIVGFPRFGERWV
ncbi:hypothetical protein AB835_10820 [Candidatus Endobugula sertula]|uniref:Uncharacterized protein n=1 Tax=Candidatus Endobugula sertula TaxID=62101 RepID=A0A1D2QN72_9GAMM|nr:hypothetical protein AB835_10820 [Candidatus Endobugula sertula]